MSWKPEVQTDSTGKWYANSLRFRTKEEAEANALALSKRWLLVRAWRATESEEESNYELVNGKLRALELSQINLYWSGPGGRPGTGTYLGMAVRHLEGWRFYPSSKLRSSHRAGRKYHQKWEDCLPRWTGGLDATTSTAVYS